MRRSPTSATRGDRGATLIAFAVSILVICTLIALFLGGSLGYSAERNSQTASDAAALAAATQLRAVQTSGAPTSEVLATAVAVAETNGADVGDVTCELVTAALVHIDDCGSASAADFDAASGVRVNTADTRDVPFGEVAGRTNVTGATLATATIQPLAEGRSPFMMCSPAPGHGPVKVLEPDNDVNPFAVGVEYMLQGTEMKNDGRDCGNPASNWRGWVEFESTFPLPGEWEIENGDKHGHIPPQLVGEDACGGDVDERSDFIGCVIAVPLCTSGNGEPGNNFRVNCVRFGAFELTHNDNGPSSCSTTNPKHICGKFLGAAIATGGQGTGDQASEFDVVVIKLAE